MGKLFALLAWLKKTGLDPANLAHIWTDVQAIYAAEDMDARVLACIHFATHLTDLIPGEIDDEVIKSLVRLTDCKCDPEEVCKAMMASGAGPLNVPAAAIEAAGELKAAGILDLE